MRKSRRGFFPSDHGDAVVVPAELKPTFDEAQKAVCRYFSDFDADPTKGTIEIGGERYVLVRASALSINFLQSICQLYADKGRDKALAIGKNFLFDMAHLIGMNDAKAFHSRMGLESPIAKLSAGPIHFAHTGWAMVHILPGSRPSTDENYYLTYHHPFSFEADSWLRAGKAADSPVCIMNAGYSSGWCEESFGISLTAVEIACRAKGDDNCTFIMAPPHRIDEYLRQHLSALPEPLQRKAAYDVPIFFEQKKAQRALEESEEKYRSFVRNFHGIAFRGRMDFTPLFFHGAVEKITGYREEEFVSGSLTWDKIIHPEDKYTLADSILNIAHKPGFSDDRAYRILRRDGSTRWVREHIQNICDEEGKPYLVEGTIYDITEHKQREEEKEELEEQLRQAEKMRVVGQLAGGIAHDFNNQLAGIIGYADLLASNCSDVMVKEAVEAILKVAQRAADLNRQLLAFARKGRNLLAPVSIHEIIDEVVSILERSIDKTITISRRLEASRCVIKGDPSLIQNAFLNLAINARDAMPNGGNIEFSTEVVSVDEGFCRRHSLDEVIEECLQVTVADTGTGMDEATRRHIFEPFFTTKKLGEGTGMGLAAVYGTVRNHNGCVEAESILGQGSVFRVLLPLAEGMEQREDPKKPALVKGQARILVADDEEAVAHVATKMLEKCGYSVATCLNGLEAVEYYRAHWREIDLVILDVMMPQMSGVEALRLMRRENPGIKVILATGYAVEGMQGMVEEGVFAVVQKPFGLQELSETVAGVLRR